MQRYLKTLRLAGVLLLGMLLPAVSFAGIRADRNVNIQAFYTFFLGSGAVISYNLGDHLSFGINYYSAIYEGDGEATENDEIVKVEFATSEFFLRIFPFEGSGLYVSGAAVMRDWSITASGYSTDFEGTGYATDYKFVAEWPNSGVAYGLGGNWTTDIGLSWGLFLGVLTGDDPKIKGTVSNSSISQADIDKGIENFEEEENFGERYNTAPLMRVSFGYAF